MSEHANHSGTHAHTAHHEIGPWQILVESDLANVLVLVIVIVYLANKFMPKFIDERNKQISKELEGAKSARMKAEEELRVIEEKCKNISTEVEEIKSEAKKTSISLKETIEKETEIEIENLKIKARKDISNAQNEAIQKIQTSASEAAIKLAEEALIKISQNPEVQQKLIDDFLHELERPSNN